MTHDYEDDIGGEDSMRDWCIRGCLAVLFLTPLACSDDDPAKPSLPCVPSEDPTPDLSLTSLDDKTFDIKNDVCENMVLLDFGATWCPPCGRGLPAMQELHETYGDRGLRVVTVNVQEEIKKVRDYFAELDITFPVLLDPQGATAHSWGVVVIPTYVLVSLEGEEVARIEGFDSNRIEDLKAEITARLGP